MLDLPGVTLCCIDTVNHALALRAMALCGKEIRFARQVLLTAGLPQSIAVPPSIEVVDIPRLDSRDAYSHFVLKSLFSYVRTSHVLLVQWDGYVINPSAWNPAFLDSDYIGAKWFWHDDGMRVGNGGFSLRSRRLLEALQDRRIELVDNEDSTICRSFRPLLECDYGIRFADEATADAFSFEAAYPIGLPFGFHGFFNFCRTVPADELAALAPTFSDAIAASPQMGALLRNCVAMGLWATVAALARRILASDGQRDDAVQALATASRQLQAPPVVGRNDPCPCGSGKRYKQCHGALGQNAPAAAPPPDADALARRGIDAHQRGELDTAEASYRAALALVPDHALAGHYLGMIHFQRGRPETALPLLEQSTRTHPAEPEFHNNLGLAQAALDRCDEAISSYRAALSLAPDHVAAWNNLGLALQAANRLPEAIAAFREAIARAPDFAQARFNLSLALLLAGLYEEGWREYEHRLAIPVFQRTDRSYPVPRWDGTPRPGLRLLLTTEQGLGDALHFIRFATMLADRGVEVLVHAQDSLRNLLASVAGVKAVFGPRDSLPDFDAHLPLLSLPGRLGITKATEGATTAYLRADPARVARLGTSIARPSPRLRRIGIAWAGNPNHANDRRRSIALAALAPLFVSPETRWYSLQSGNAAAMLPSLREAAEVVPLASPEDLDETAALVATLDLVISVDTSIAHLAAGLGKPTWILLPCAPDWRWGLTGSDTPWYPTVRLFRQPVPGDWASVVGNVVAALAGG